MTPTGPTATGPAVAVALFWKIKKTKKKPVFLNWLYPVATGFIT
jgi:hypothetical protein